MSAGQIIVNVIYIILSIAIIVMVLFQSAKSTGLSGTIAGGAETFFGKNKGKTIDALLSKYTSFVAIAFLVVSLVLFMLLKGI
ncbi:MAG TPA: preprotein translocase subunit SecG [Clostridiaceae bacterium]|nr:preprotein translocase subunit SecG [Clostridiaceae bacterium]